ncbi:MAG: adenosylmethionine decarboxylase [Planctomycetaceae bacterium]|nr:adenosylmethionine decarboxylase [Planctomycetaceae bacterium]
MATGREWIVDAHGCSAALLADAEAIRAACEDVITTLGLHVVGAPQWHRFPAPGGVTGMYLLSESHLACHTWPESGFATFNLFCCRPRPAYRWREALREFLGADDVRVRCVGRGIEVVDAGERWLEEAGTGGGHA